jgi:hypothetical protein
MERIFFLKRFYWSMCECAPSETPSAAVLEVFFKDLSTAQQYVKDVHTSNVPHQFPQIDETRFGRVEENGFFVGIQIFSTNFNYNS